MIKVIFIFLLLIASIAKADILDEVLYIGLRNDFSNAYVKAYVKNDVDEDIAQSYLKIFGLSADLSSIKQKTIECFHQNNITLQNVFEKRKETDLCAKILHNFYKHQNQKAKDGLSINDMFITEFLDIIQERESIRLSSLDFKKSFSNIIIQIAESRLDTAKEANEIRKCLNKFNNDYLKIDYKKDGQACFETYDKHFQGQALQVIRELAKSRFAEIVYGKRP